MPWQHVLADTAMAACIYLGVYSSESKVQCDRFTLLARQLATPNFLDAMLLALVCQDLDCMYTTLLCHVAHAK